LRRLDLELVKRGLARSRDEAKSLIESGQVLVNGFRIDKTSTLVSDKVSIKVKKESSKYVSRAALKLLSVLPELKINFQNKLVLDAGSSTGGFVQVALERGARKVYAVDVGYGQLAWSLQTNPRVVVMDRTNIKDLTPDVFPEKVDLITADLSFISLRNIMKVLVELVKPQGDILVMVKPQFEVGKFNVGKGVVGSRELRQSAILNVVQFAKQLNWVVVGAVESSVHGPNGNREFFLHLRQNGAELSQEVISERVSGDF